MPLQPVPNAFELFGADLLLTHAPEGGFKLSILELNAEPAIENTGPRLRWVLEELFYGMGTACVRPFFAPKLSECDEAVAWHVGQTQHGLLKCLEEEIRARNAW